MQNALDACQLDLTIWVTFPDVLQKLPLALPGDKAGLKWPVS